MKYQKRYESLRVALRNFFSWNQDRDDFLAEFSGLCALLKERKGRQAEDAKLEDEEEWNHEQKMMETGAKEDEKIEEALDYLLDKAIERFGYTARAVFKAIFDFDAATEDSRHAFNMISFRQLKDTVISLAGNGTVNFGLSNQIVAIRPVYSASHPFTKVNWKVAFNSDWVATEVTKRLKAAENIEVRSVIQHFQGIRQAASMVGSLFEPLVHTLIPKGDSRSLIRMVSDMSEESPKFVVPPKASLHNEVKLDLGTRTTFNFKCVSELSKLELNDKMYYVPDATNFELLDSFIVDIDYLRRSATLWIFQVAKSELHRGSAKGCLHVRKLISILKNQLKEKQPPSKTAKVTSGQSPSKPVVNVNYVLVVLKVEGGSGNWGWRFPPGWDKGCTYNDHRGPVYCLEISV